MMCSRQSWLWLLPALLAAFLIGCSGGTSEDFVPVKGTLSIGGQPLTWSAEGPMGEYGAPQLRLVNDETGEEFAAQVNEDGSFEVPGPEGKGIPAGTYKIFCTQVDPQTEEDKFGGKYDEEKSTLTETVQGPEATLNIDLEAGGAPAAGGGEAE